MPTIDDAIRKMKPFIVEGTYWICTSPENSGTPENAIGIFKESKGISVVIKQEKKPNMICSSPKSMIDVGVDTPVGCEGFLARLTKALADKNIGVYAYSAYYRDYLFVPKEKSKEALDSLKSLKNSWLE